MWESFLNTVRRLWNWSLVDCSSWTPEVAKKRSVSRWVCKSKRHTKSLCIFPDVLVIAGIKEIVLEGRLLKKIFLWTNSLWWQKWDWYRSGMFRQKQPDGQGQCLNSMCRTSRYWLGHHHPHDVYKNVSLMFTRKVTRNNKGQHLRY